MSEQACVYLVEAENGTIKIGCAVDPKRRLSAIRTHSPLLVRLIAFWPGTYVDEQALHARFRDARKHCEWFWPEGEFASFADHQRGLGVGEPEDWTDLLYFSADKKARHARKIGEAHQRFWQDPAKRRERLITYKARRIYKKDFGHAFGAGFDWPAYEEAVAQATAEYDAANGIAINQSEASA